MTAVRCPMCALTADTHAVKTCGCWFSRQEPPLGRLREILTRPYRSEAEARAEREARS